MNKESLRGKNLPVLLEKLKSTNAELKSEITRLEKIMHDNEASIREINEILYNAKEIQNDN